MFLLLSGFVLGFACGGFFAYLIQAILNHYSDKITQKFRKWLFKD